MVLLSIPMVSPLALPSNGSSEIQYLSENVDQSPEISQRLSVAKESSGIMAKNATIMTSIMAITGLALPSFTSDTCPDLPVTVVNDFLLPVTLLLTVSMMMENIIRTMAIT